MENSEMKFKAVLALAAMLTMSLVGFAYGTSANESGEQQIVALKQTVNELQQRIAKLEARVDDMSRAKLEKIDGGFR
jgi:cell division protein FtsB